MLRLIMRELKLLGPFLLLLWEDMTPAVVSVRPEGLGQGWQFWLAIKATRSVSPRQELGTRNTSQRVIVEVFSTQVGEQDIPAPPNIHEDSRQAVKVTALLA